MNQQHFIKILPISGLLLVLNACSYYTVPPVASHKMADPAYHGLGPDAPATVSSETTNRREYETLKGYQAWQAATPRTPMVPPPDYAVDPENYRSHTYRRPTIMPVIPEPKIPQPQGNLYNRLTGETYLNTGTGYINLQGNSRNSSLGRDLINPQTGEIYYGTGTGYVSPQGHFLQDFGNGLIGTPNGLVRPVPY